MNKLFFAAVLASASYGASAAPKTSLPPRRAAGNQQ